MVYQEIRSIHVLTEASLTRELESLSLTVSQWNALSAIARNDGPLLMGELSSTLLIDNTTMTRVIDVLENMHAVRRTSISADRRARPVELTAAGQELYESGRAAVERVEQGLTAGFSRDQRAALAETLSRLKLNLTDQSSK